MQRSSLSLKSLEVFCEIAKSGHVQVVARDTGLSISTVSHHLKKLDETLGVKLLDHSKRPMALTPEGHAFLTYVTEALTLLRKAEGEALSGRLSDVRSLRLALIEDFDSHIAPDLAAHLARAMPKCRFVHLTRPSHEILELLQNRSIDIGIATEPQFEGEGLIEYPLLRDPFIVALPAAAGHDATPFLDGRSALPFLRYSDSQIIGTQITSHLRRLRIDLPKRFQFESNQSLLGMVADEAGWAITTPTNVMRASQFADRINLVAFPGKEFARTISLFAQDGFAPATTSLIWKSARALIERHTIQPALETWPWLNGKLCLLNTSDPT